MLIEKYANMKDYPIFEKKTTIQELQKLITN